MNSHLSRNHLICFEIRTSPIKELHVNLKAGVRAARGTQDPVPWETTNKRIVRTEKQGCWKIIFLVGKLIGLMIVQHD
jgi:hypothetical protein